MTVLDPSNCDQHKPVDRRSRDILAECLRLFLEGKVNREELFWVVCECSTSDDPTLRQLVDPPFIEDVETSVFADPSEMSKRDWDALQRSLLLLDSNRHIEESWEYIWTRWQWLAVFGCFGWLGFSVLFGIWEAFTWLSIPAAALSYWISRQKEKKLRISPYREALNPFESFSSLKATLDEVRCDIGFVKMQCPNAKKPADPFDERYATLTWMVLLVVVPTMILLPFQALPVMQRHQRIVPV